MLQIFVYFEHRQIVLKLQPTKIFTRDCRFLPRIITLMVKETCDISQKVRISPMCPWGCGLKDEENSKIKTSKIYSSGKIEIILKFAPMKISRYMVLYQS